MKHFIRYQSFIIPKKFKCEVRITIDLDKVPEYNTKFEGNNITGLLLMPMINLSIIRPSEMDDTGNRLRPPFNPNDAIFMSKFTLPILIGRLKEIKNGMKIQDLYTYQGKRLELNEKIAETIRSVFQIGSMYIELSAVVIIQPEDDSRIEGIKIKFNNEQSSVLLTINELDSLIYNLEHMDIDNVALIMYMNYCKANNTVSYNNSSISPKIDIVPKE